MRKLVIGIIAGTLVVAAMVVVSLLSQERTTQQEIPVAKKEFSYSLELQHAFDTGNLVEARRILRQTMLEIEDAETLKDVQKKLEDLSMNILFSPTNDDCSTVYEVKPNDALSKIARRHNTTVGLLKRSNGLQSDMIKPGQKLKVNTCSFSIAIDKSQNVLSLIQNGEVIKRYIVSTGADNGTPTGTFKIITKLKNPTWYRTGAVIPPDSPENILGTRWMGFDLRGYGIHGTTEPQQLGKQVTLGCVRMKNEDVEELYDIVPTQTEVTIVE
jgi:LysM repeat protein